MDMIFASLTLTFTVESTNSGSGTLSLSMRIILICGFLCNYIHSAISNATINYRHVVYII